MNLSISFCESPEASHIQSPRQQHVCLHALLHLQRRAQRGSLKVPRREGTSRGSASTRHLPFPHCPFDRRDRHETSKVTNEGRSRSTRRCPSARPRRTPLTSPLCHRVSSYRLSAAPPSPPRCVPRSPPVAFQSASDRLLEGSFRHVCGRRTRSKPFSLFPR